MRRTWTAIHRGPPRQGQGTRLRLHLPLHLAGQVSPDGDPNDAAFPVRATVTWAVSWSAEGAPGQGVFRPWSPGSRAVRVVQVQSINSTPDGCGLSSGRSIVAFLRRDSLVTSLLERRWAQRPGMGRSGIGCRFVPRRRKPCWPWPRPPGPGQCGGFRQPLLVGRSPCARTHGDLDDPARAPITAAQLGTAEVASSPGLSPIPVSSASSLSGKWATVTIPAGSLLTHGDVTSNRPLSGGTAVVGLALKDGQLPSNGVVPGDRVMIVQTLTLGTCLSGDQWARDQRSRRQSQRSGIVGRGPRGPGRVFETATPPTSNSSGAAELVSVTVPSTLASTVATAAAASEVSVVLLPAGPADSGTGPGSGSVSGSP